MPTIAREQVLSSPIVLQGMVQHYRWGQPGSRSRIASLLGRSNEPLPFAELWFGAHPRGSSTIQTSGSLFPLTDLLERHAEEVLGRTVFEQFGTLPFLLKVLSIDRPLSIQAHPDWDFAARLNEKHPELYPDRNHKPELALALTDVEVLYGFRPALSPEAALARIPEFKLLVGQHAERLPEFFCRLMRAPEDAVGEASKRLYDRLREKPDLLPDEAWVLRMEEQFPDGDVGLFVFFLMNLVRLAPGEALFTKPGVLHAYLRGELLECMATSDNVVRGGLTEKPRDVETLCTMLDYRGCEFQPLSPKVISQGVREFAPPVEEFRLGIVDSFVTPISCCNQDRVELLFSLGAEGVVDSPGGSIRITDGTCVLVPATVRSYELLLSRGSIARIWIP